MVEIETLTAAILGKIGLERAAGEPVLVVDQEAIGGLLEQFAADVAAEAAAPSAPNPNVTQDLTCPRCKGSIKLSELRPHEQRHYEQGEIPAPRVILPRTPKPPVDEDAPKGRTAPARPLPMLEKPVLPPTPAPEPKKQAEPKQKPRKQW